MALPWRRHRVSRSGAQPRFGHQAIGDGRRFGGTPGGERREQRAPDRESEHRSASGVWPKRWQSSGGDARERRTQSPQRDDTRRINSSRAHRVMFAEARSRSMYGIQLRVRDPVDPTATLQT